MAKTTASASVETIKPVAKKSKNESKPKEQMFISGKIQIPASFEFTKEQFIERFRGQKLGQDINKLYLEYQKWCVVNK